MKTHVRISLILATTFLTAGVALGQQNDQPDRQKGKQKEGKRHDSANKGGMDWDRAIEQMNEDGVTLKDAISKAESKVNGNAISAHVVCKSMAHQRSDDQQHSDSGEKMSQYQIEVQCRANDGMYKIVSIDGKTGEVIGEPTTSSTPFAGDQFAYDRSAGTYGDGHSSRDRTSTTGMDSGRRDQNRDGSTVRVMKYSTLEGAEVRNRAGEDLGHIADFAIDPQSGRISYAAISFGGWLGMGDKLFAVPLSALEVVHEDRVLLDVSKEELKSAEGFNQDRWPLQANTRWATELASRTQPSHLTGADGHHGTRDMNEDPITSVKKGAKIVGMKVENLRDEDLGSVSDLYLDLDNSKVCYAVLSHGGVLGMGDKLFAIPWKSLRMDAQDNELVIDIEKSRLEQAPSATAADASTWNNPDWVVTVYEFHHIDPYWTHDSRYSTNGTDRENRNRDGMGGNRDRTGTDGDRDPNNRNRDRNP